MAWFNDDVELTVTTDKIATTLKYWHDSHVLLVVSMRNGLAAISVNGGNPSSTKERNAFLDAITHAKAVIRAYEKSGSWSDAWLVMPPVHGLEIRADRYENGVVDTAYMIDKSLICNLTKEPKVQGHSYVSFYSNNKCNPEDIALLYMFAKKQLEVHEKALEEKKQEEEKKRAEEDRVRSIVTEEREAFLTDLLRRMGYGWKPESKWEVLAVGVSVMRDFASDGIPEEGYVNCGNRGWSMHLRLRNHVLPQYIAGGVWGVVNE